MRPSIVLSLLAATALAGCGGGAPKTPEVAAERAVYTNARDCATGNKITIEQCSEAINKAIAEHEATAPKYTSIRSCETAEGEGKCDRIADKQFRPRLLAFLVTLSKPPVARPLYATIGGEQGFRLADKTMLLGTDETLTFSTRATAAYELNSKPVKKGLF